MKEKRQGAILELVEKYDIETQEDLANKLISAGFKATQATISRDIKELHLIKIQSDDGDYKYAVNENKNYSNIERLIKVFKNTVVSISNAGNIVVINTLSGSANAAAEMIDMLEVDDIVGTIAGDNTIFVAICNIESVPIVVQKFRKLLK